MDNWIMCWAGLPDAAWNLRNSESLSTIADKFSFSSPYTMLIRWYLIGHRWKCIYAHVKRRLQISFSRTDSDSWFHQIIFVISLSNNVLFAVWPVCVVSRVFHHALPQAAGASNKWAPPQLSVRDQGGPSCFQTNNISVTRRAHSFERNFFNHQLFCRTYKLSLS